MSIFLKERMDFVVGTSKYRVPWLILSGCLHFFWISRWLMSHPVWASYIIWLRRKKDLWNSSWKLFGQIHVMVFWKSNQSKVQMLDVVSLIYFVDQIIRNGRFNNPIILHVYHVEPCDYTNPLLCMCKQQNNFLVWH